MKIYTSYFYKIRFFPQELVPLSTAVWDPTWYHNNQGHKYIFRDRRGVLNGCRATPFVPGEECNNLCRGSEHCNAIGPESCAFLSTYLRQLRKLNFNEILQRFENLRERIGNKDFALIFHEAPQNPCSERWMVQKWFKENGMEITEWQE